MKKLLSLLLFLLLVISCKQKDDAVDGLSRYDIAGRWRVDPIMSNVLLNLDGSGAYEDGFWCEDYPLTWSLEGNVLEMSWTAHDETKCYKIRVDSVTNYYEGREEYRRLHVTPLSDVSFRDRWDEVK